MKNLPFKSHLSYPTKAAPTVIILPNQEIVLGVVTIFGSFFNDSIAPEEYPNVSPIPIGAKRMAPTAAESWKTQRPNESTHLKG